MGVSQPLVSPRRAGMDHMVDEFKKGKKQEKHGSLSLGSELLELGLLGAWGRHEADPLARSRSPRPLLHQSCPPLSAQGHRKSGRRKRESGCKRDRQAGHVSQV